MITAFTGFRAGSSALTWNCLLLLGYQFVHEIYSENDIDFYSVHLFAYYLHRFYRILTAFTGFPVFHHVYVY